MMGTEHLSYDRVDTITGATNSSKVIMKAVENALEGDNVCLK